MNGRSHSDRSTRRLRSELGQVLPMTALMLAVLFAFASLVIDIGRVWVAQRQLQNAVDAASLAAGQDLPNAQTALNDAISYSGTGKNQLTGYGVTPNAPTVTFKCLQTLSQNHVPCNPSSAPAGAPCTGTGGVVTATCNAVNVTETATVSTTFLRALGAVIPGFSFNKFTVKATSTAAARGGVPHPLDVAVVVDTTASMNSSCGDNVPGITNGQADRIDCAKEGVQTLLSGLLPCSQSYQSCAGEPPLDEAALLVFPELTNPAAYTHDTTTPSTTLGAHNNLSLEFGCPGGVATAPPWYQTGSGQNNDEVQKVTVTGVQFTLTFGGKTTASLTKAGLTAASLQNTLQGLSSIGAGNVAVSGNTGGPFTVTFVGLLGNQNVAQMTATGATVTTTTPGAALGGFPGFFLDSGDISYGAALQNYDLTGLSNDFKTSDTSALNPQSPLVDAVTWDTCPNMKWPGNEYYGANSPGGAGTYYADAINAAQALLATDSNRGAQHVIILLSDGQANKDPHNTGYPCADAVQAAQAAAQAGTWIYSVAYGDTTYNTACDGKYTAVSAMQYIARNQTDTALNQWDPSKFFCDPVPAGMPAGVTCNSASTLNDIFQSIGTDLTDSRLIPDNTS